MSQGTVAVVANSLLESAIDGNADVSRAASQSLYRIADRYPNDILKICCQYCNKNRDQKSAGRQNVANVLQMISVICETNVSAIDGDQILDLLSITIDLMTQQSKELIIQEPAAAILVALAGQHCVRVSDSLMEKVVAGIVPHYTIPQTLGQLATANVPGFVPALKPILGLLLPLIGNLKGDLLRLAFTNCFGSFSEAILEYTANLEQAPDTTITHDYFLTEMSMIYEVMFTQLTQTREQVLLESTINAISSLFALISQDKVRQYTSKTVLALLTLYKRNKESFPVTICLSSILSISTTLDGTLVEPHLAVLWPPLSDLISVAADYAQPERLRTHTEALRCYQTLCTCYTDNCLDHVFGMIKSNNEKDKVRGLVILTHLCNSTGDSLRNRLSDVMTTVGEQINAARSGSNLRVHRALMRAILAFAYKDFLPSSGAATDKYLEYLIFLCIKCGGGAEKGVSSTAGTPTDKDKHSPDVLESDDLKQSAGANLYLLATAGKSLESALCQQLSQCILNVDYTEAVSAMLRSLTYLWQRDDVVKDPFLFEDLFIRCLTILIEPKPAFRGNLALNFLKHLNIFNYDGFGAAIGELQHYLEHNYDSFLDADWSTMLHKFLTGILSNLKYGPEYAEKFVHCITSQLPMYNSLTPNSSWNTILVQEKDYLLTTLGLLGTFLPKSDKSLSQLLDLIIVNGRGGNYAELNSCGRALAVCAASHPEPVLDKLATGRKEALQSRRQSTGGKLFRFSFMGGDNGVSKDGRNEEEADKMRYLALVGYRELCDIEKKPQVAAIIRQAVDENIMSVLLEELALATNGTKDFFIRKAALETVEAVANFVIALTAKTPSDGLQQKFGLIETVASYLQLHSGPEHIELFPTVLKTLRALVKIPSTSMDPAKRVALLKLVFDTVFNASAIYCKLQPDSFGDLKLSPVVYKSFAAVQALVTATIEQTLAEADSACVLDEVVELLVPWLGKKKVEHRLPALETLRTALDTYLNRVSFTHDVRGTARWTKAGWLLAHLAPRCTDPLVTIRQQAVDCIRLLLTICGRCDGLDVDYNAQLSTLFDPPKKLAEYLDVAETNTVTGQPDAADRLPILIGRIIAMNLPGRQIATYSIAAVHTLLDVEAASSAGAASLLNTVLDEAPAGELNEVQLREVAQLLLLELPKMKCAQTKGQSLQVFVRLARYEHGRRQWASTVITELMLQQALPYDPCVRQVWFHLAQDPDLAPAVLNKIIEELKTGKLVDIDKSRMQHHFVTLPPFQAISALEQVLQLTNMVSLTRKHFAQLFSLFFITLTKYIGVSVPATSGAGLKPFNRDAYKMNPFRTCAVAFKHFLGDDVCECTDTLAALLEMTENLVRFICRNHDNQVAWLVANLGTHLASEQDATRTAVAKFLSHLFASDNRQVLDKGAIAETILEMLIERQHDECQAVRAICMQTLGSAVSWRDGILIERYGPTFISVLMSGLDYSNNSEWEVALSSMVSFTALLKSLDQYADQNANGIAMATTLEAITQCQVSAATRIKPLMQHEDVRVRAAAFELLGALAATVQRLNTGVEAFREQVYSNLIILLLHLSDPEEEVVKICKYTLRNVGPFLESPRSNAMLQNHLKQKCVLQYENFITDLVQCMEAEMKSHLPQLATTALFYLRSTWWEVRAAAALTAGLLYSVLDAEHNAEAAGESVCQRLVRHLGSEEKPEVRSRAAQALSLVLSS